MAEAMARRRMAEEAMKTELYLEVHFDHIFHMKIKYA
jgi:hypothetical protein